MLCESFQYSRRYFRNIFEFFPMQIGSMGLTLILCHSKCMYLRTVFLFPLQNQFINFIVDMASNIESQYHAFLNVDIVNDLPFLRMTKHGWKHFFFLSKSFNNYIVITFHSCHLTKGRVQNIHKSTWNFSTIQFQDTIYPFVVSMLVE